MTHASFTPRRCATSCHVLAVAIRSNASVIVTFNQTDFPATTLEPLGIEAQHPDEFAEYLFDLLTMVRGRASAIELVFRLGWPLFNKRAALLRRITMSRVLTHAAT
jgi:hypothetical protein